MRPMPRNRKRLYRMSSPRPPCDSYPGATTVWFRDLATHDLSVPGQAAADDDFVRNRRAAALARTGHKASSMPRVISVPTRPFDQKIESEPFDMIIDCLNAS